MLVQSMNSSEAKKICANATYSHETTVEVKAGCYRVTIIPIGEELMSSVCAKSITVSGSTVTSGKPIFTSWVAMC